MGDKVLVVEDEPTLLETLEYNLARQGYEVHTATDALSALEIARRERPDAIVLDIISELERIGDYAKGISKINLMMGEAPFVKPLIDIPRMAEKARDMLHRALKAFVQQDVDLARAIPDEDDEVDALYNQVYRELLTFIMNDPRTIDQATYLLWAAHNLERAADRVINICERVVFAVTGKMMEMDVEDSASPFTD